MKKFGLLLAVLILSSTGSAFADCDYACVTPYDMNNKFKTFVGAVSGVNFTSEKVAESLIKKEIFKIAKADNVKVNLDSYSSKDLKNGIFKSLQISGDNVSINEISLASLSLKTLCKFNYIKQSGDNIVFMEDLPMSFSANVTESNLNEMMNNARYQKIVKDFNRIIGAYAKGVEISSTKMAIRNRKFYYSVGFNIPFLRNEQKIVLQSDVFVKNSKIELTNAKMVSGSFNMDLHKADFLINYLNPFNFSVNILKDKNAQIAVQNIEMNKEGNGILVNGIITVPKESHE
jgi:hypothetical protein